MKKSVFYLKLSLAIILSCHQAMVEAKNVLPILQLLLLDEPTTQHCDIEIKDFKNTDGSSSPLDSYFIEFKGEMYFASSDESHGRELWKTDGTDAGTVLVKDILPGKYPSSPQKFFIFNDELFFTAATLEHGFEPWKTDGTELGTVMLKDTYEMEGFSGFLSFSKFIEFENKLFFAAAKEGKGTELWVSDGTTDGTVMFKDINPGSESSNPVALTVYQNRLFFSAIDPLHGDEVWVSDGTPGGTMLFKDINPGVSNSVPFNYTVFNNELIFRATDGTNGLELWKSDGTPENTIMLKDIYTGGHSSPQLFTEFNGYLYFFAFDSINGSGLWRTDATTSGTEIVKSISTDQFSKIRKISVHDDMIYFFADTLADGDELWRSDGTSVNTKLVSDLNAGPNGSTTFSKGMISYNNELYYDANDGIRGYELWKIDFVTKLPVFVKDFDPTGGSNSHSFPSNFYIFNDALYLYAETGYEKYLRKIFCK